MPDIVTAGEVASAWPAFAALPEARQAQLIRDASDVIESDTGVIFGARDLVEYHDGPGSRVLWLSRHPVVSITSVEVDDTAVDSGSYDFDPDTGLLYRKSGWWGRGFRSVKVTYRAGYETVPDAVKRAAILTIQYHADMIDTGATGAFKSYSFGDESFTMADGMEAGGIPPAARSILSRYAGGADVFA